MTDHAKKVRALDRKGSLFQIVLLCSSVLIVCLFGFGFYVARNVTTLKELSMSAVELLSKWNSLGSATRDILINRSNPAVDDSQGLEGFRREWIRMAADFDSSFEALRANEKLALLKTEWRDKMDSAFVLWTITDQKLKAADKDLEEVIASGLEKKVFPGFLYNYYTKREQGRLSFDEVVLLMNFSNQIAVFDISSNEFNRELNEIATGVKIEAEAESERIIVISACALLFFLVAAAMAFKILREYSVLRAEKGMIEEESRLRAIRELLLDSRGGDAGSPSPPKAAALPTDPSKDMAVVLLRVNRFADFCAGHNKRERDEIMSSILRRIEEESGRASVPCAGTDFEQHLALILNPPEGVSSAEARVSAERLVEGMRGLARKAFGLSFSATICPIPGGTVALSGHYLRAVQASNYRFTRGADAIIWADETEALSPSSTYVYPIEKEGMLCTAIKLGKYEEARKEYKEIVGTAVDYPYYIAQSVVLRTALAVSSTIETVERNNGSKILSDIVSLISRINGLETLVETDFAFYDVFRSVAECMETIRKDKHVSLVTGVDKLIEEGYKNPNFSLNLIADELRLSPSYVGRVYRKLSSRSVAEAITKKRLDVAAALLRDTRLPVHEIAAGIGISNGAYFFTLFKKTYGLTPKEFRVQAPASSSTPSVLECRAP
jgi:AraC-like DNA-binding protein